MPFLWVIVLVSRRESRELKSPGSESVALPLVAYRDPRSTLRADSLHKRLNYGKSPGEVLLSHLDPLTFCRNIMFNLNIAALTSWGKIFNISSQGLKTPVVF